MWKKSNKHIYVKEGKMWRKEFDDGFPPFLKCQMYWISLTMNSNWDKFWKESKYDFFFNVKTKYFTEFTSEFWIGFETK